MEVNPHDLEIAVSLKYSTKSFGSVGRTGAHANERVGPALPVDDLGSSSPNEHAVVSEVVLGELFE